MTLSKVTNWLIETLIDDMITADWDGCPSRFKVLQISGKPR